MQKAVVDKKINNTSCKLVLIRESVDRLLTEQ